MRISLRRGAVAVSMVMAPVVFGPAVAAAGPEQTAAARPSPAPLHQNRNAVPGQYIVTLARDADPARVADQLGVKPLFTYPRAPRGFAARLSPEQVERLRGQPEVHSVEEDAVLRIPVPAPDAGAEPRPGTGTAVGVTGHREPAVPWGLARINSRKPGTSTFSVNATGARVTSYIIDSGIDLAHPDFGGRAQAGQSFVQDGRGAEDCAGHGTHVAGTVGGTESGVAKQTSLVSVRIFDCAGESTSSTVVAALNWVATHARQPAVANLSLGGPRSLSVNQAVEDLAAANVFPVVAAGNDAADACTVSPASSTRAYTVAATDRQDRPASFSNWGQCVDINAPGVAIRSAVPGGTFREMEGTSMATPHVTGVAALYKDTYGDVPFDTLASWLTGNATPGIDTTDEAGRATGTPPLLAYTGGL